MRRCAVLLLVIWRRHRERRPGARADEGIPGRRRRVPARPLRRGAHAPREGARHRSRSCRARIASSRRSRRRRAAGRTASTRRASRSPRTRRRPRRRARRKLHAACRVSAGRTPYQRAELVDSAAIAVTTNIPGATVKIGGLTYGGTPLAPRPITPGKLELDIDKPGWKPAHVAVDAPAGIVTDVAIELEPDPNAQQNPDSAKGPRRAAEDRLARSSAGAARHGHRRRQAGHAAARSSCRAGEHTIEARAPDHDAWRRRVRAHGRQKVRAAPRVRRDGRARARPSTSASGSSRGGAALSPPASSPRSSPSTRPAMRARSSPRRERSAIRTNPGYDFEPKHTRADFDVPRATARTRTRLVSDVAIGAGLGHRSASAPTTCTKASASAPTSPPPFAIAPTHGGAFVAKELRW